MAENEDVMTDPRDTAYKPDETEVDDQIITPLSSEQSSQNYKDHDAYMEVDVSLNSTNFENRMTEVLPLGRRVLTLDQRIQQLLDSQINLYQNPYNLFERPPENFHFSTPKDNLEYNSNNRKKINLKYIEYKRNKKELKKKDKVVLSENILGYRGDQNINEILKFIGDKSSDSEKDQDNKTKNKIKSRRGFDDNNSGGSKNRQMKMTKYKSVEKVSISTVFQHMDSSDDEFKPVKSNEKEKKKISKQSQLSKKFTSTEERLDVLSQSENTDFSDFLLVTNKKGRKKQKSQNKLSTTTSYFPRNSYLPSQYTRPKNVKNKENRKSAPTMLHYDKYEDNNSDFHSVYSLLPVTIISSVQPPCNEASKTELTKPASVVTTSEESIPLVTVAISQQNADFTASNNTDGCVIGDAHDTYIIHELQKSDSETIKKTAILNKVPATISPQSASLTVRKLSKEKQSPIMYNKYEVDTTNQSFGLEINKNALYDNGNDYSPPTSIPMPIEYNYNEVVLFIKQAWEDVEKEKIEGKSNILEYKRDNNGVLEEI